MKDYSLKENRIYKLLVLTCVKKQPRRPHLLGLHVGSLLKNGSLIRTLCVHKQLYA